MKEILLPPAVKCLRTVAAMETGFALLFLLIGLSVAGALLRPHLYHTLWFSLPAGLLCLNLALNSWRQFCSLFKAPFGVSLLPPGGIESCPVYRCLPVPTGEKKTLSLAASRLKSQGFRLQPLAERQESGFYAVKGWPAPWGTLAVHIALLLIISGAAYGRQHEFTVNTFLPAGGIYELNTAGNTRLTLRLHNFITRYYRDGTFSDWISDVSLEQNGHELVRQKVKVNEPLNYKGLKIYQMSYSNRIRTQVLTSSGAAGREALLKEGDILTVDEPAGLAIQPVGVTPQGRIFYWVYHQGQPFCQGTISPEKPLSLTSRVSVRFGPVIPFSGLYIKRDPAVPWLGIGFVLLTAGLFLSLYSRRVSLWLTVTTSQGTLVRLGSWNGEAAAILDNLRLDSTLSRKQGE
ncbi:cytochrome c biogenesis protein ResB [Lucifera butyrica]|nr:cytochrome c biogenesis protein ResB [Lucifera butyrica]